MLLGCRWLHHRPTDRVTKSHGSCPCDYRSFGKVDDSDGPTGIGVESTVVDCTGAKPIILRPYVSKEALEKVIGEFLDPHVLAARSVETGPVRSPGMKYKHYAKSSSSTGGG